MRIFLSYAAEHSLQVELVAVRLRAAGYEVFFAPTDLPAAGGFDLSIRAAILRSDVFIAFVSKEYVTLGRYTITEMHIAENRWHNPAGRVLTVVIDDIQTTAIPPYLKAATFLISQGELAADILSAIEALRARARWRLVLEGVKIALRDRRLWASVGLILLAFPVLNRKSRLYLIDHWNPFRPAEYFSPAVTNWSDDFPQKNVTEQKWHLNRAQWEPAVTTLSGSGWLGISAPGSATTLKDAPGRAFYNSDILMTVDLLRGSEADWVLRVWPTPPAAASRFYRFKLKLGEAPLQVTTHSQQTPLRPISLEGYRCSDPASCMPLVGSTSPIGYQKCPEDTKFQINGRVERTSFSYWVYIVRRGWKCEGAISDGPYPDYFEDDSFLPLPAYGVVALMNDVSGTVVRAESILMSPLGTFTKPLK